jgi:hypothetical protein
MWDTNFVEAFACKLAFELAEDLTQSNQKKGTAFDEYKLAIMTAVRSSSIEQPAQDLPDNSWLLSRL